MNHVVLFDPTGDLLEGEIVNSRRFEIARSKRVETLPLDLDMLRATALGGYAKRAYGQGWRFEPHRPGRGCPLVLYAVTRMPSLIWTVRLVPEPGAEPGAHRDGQIRVAVDSGQLGAMGATLRAMTDPLSVAALGEPDAEGGWYWRGNGLLTMQGDALVPLMLYGMANGVRVAWWAVSQAPQDGEP